MDKLIVASNNAHKIEEFKEKLKPFGIEVLSLKDANIISTPDETGTTFFENALIKAQDVKSKTSLPVISDDSGLRIHALNNFPGVHSARFMEDRPYSEKWIAINEMLKDKDDCNADFQCVLCLVNVDGEPLYFDGCAEGKIVQPDGTHGFGYDPIFYSFELNKTFGSASSEEKNRVSHRAKALDKFVEYLTSHNI